MSQFHKIYFFLLLLTFSLFGPPVQSQNEWVKVSKFVDGDTFWINNFNGEPEKIRLIGVDAPETRKTGKKEAGYFGKEAAAYLVQLLESKRFRLEYDVSKKDRFKRTLAYVFLEDGTFLNAHLVENGYAMVMTVPPNVKYVDLLVKLQSEARKQKRGLWAIP